jgi:hypothetical protein
MNRPGLITKLRNENIVLRGELKTAKELNKELRALLKTAKEDAIHEQWEREIVRLLEYADND